MNQRTRSTRTRSTTAPAVHTALAVALVAVIAADLPVLPGPLGATRAVAQDGPAAHGTTTYLGLEVAELAQNRFRDLGPSNYTLLAGQRFTDRGTGRWGWRVVSMNVELSEEHLGNPATVCCIEGNREGLRGRLAVHRVYVDYHITDLSWGFLRFTPAIAAGAGHTREELVNTRLDEEWSFATPAVALLPRLQFTFFDRVFLEYPALELSLHRRRAQPELGDVRVEKPEHFSMFGWATLGVRLPL